MMDLKQLIEMLEAVESDEEMDYLEKMRLQFEIKDLIAAEELRLFLEEQ